MSLFKAFLFHKIKNFNILSLINTLKHQKNIFKEKNSTALLLDYRGFYLYRYDIELDNNLANISNFRSNWLKNHNMWA